MLETKRILIAELSKKQRAFLSIAAELASLSNYGNYKHGAILVKGGRIMSSSFNKNRFNSFGLRFRKRDTGYSTYHAELGCVFGMPREVTEGSTIYVVRIGKGGELRLSRPCVMCHSVMEHCGVHKVVYSYDADCIETYKF